LKNIRITQKLIGDINKLFIDMENLIKFISDHEFIQNEIINSNDETIDALYYLLIHYGCSVEYLLKSLFSAGFAKNGIYFFRKGTKEFTIIADFLKNYGGNFNLLCQKICELAQKENIWKNNKNKKIVPKYIKKLKVVIPKTIEIIDELLPELMSETLIDLCSHMCIFLNGFFKDEKDPYFGEKLLCSFIFFSIIGPKILKSAELSQIQHVVPLVKVLNAIALNEDNKYQTEHEKIRDVIARTLMKRKNSKYIHQSVLPEDEYVKKCNTLVMELRKNPSKYDPNGNSASIPLMTHSSHVDCIMKTIDDGSRSKKIIKNGISKKISFNNLLNNASPIPKFCSLPNDLKYFLLWTSSDVLALGMIEELDTIFIEKWMLDGKNFISLTREILCEMGMSDFKQITKIVKCIDNIRNVAICDTQKLNKSIITWTSKDLCIWLVLNGLDNLVEIFTKHDINCAKLLKMNHETFFNLGIIKPKDIAGLTILKKNI
jgi:hypothetical protein